MPENMTQTDLVFTLTGAKARLNKVAYLRVLDAGNYVYKKWPLENGLGLANAQSLGQTENEYSEYGYIAFLQSKAGFVFCEEAQPINWRQQRFEARTLGNPFGVRIWLRAGVSVVAGNIEIGNPWRILWPAA